AMLESAGEAGHGREGGQGLFRGGGGKVSGRGTPIGIRGRRRTILWRTFRVPHYCFLPSLPPSPLTLPQLRTGRTSLQPKHRSRREDRGQRQTNSTPRIAIKSSPTVARSRALSTTRISRFSRTRRSRRL